MARLLVGIQAPSAARLASRTNCATAYRAEMHRQFMKPQPVTTVVMHFAKPKTGHLVSLAPRPDGSDRSGSRARPHIE